MKKILLPILLIMVLAFSRTAVPTQQGRTAQIKIHNINQVECCVSNFGKFGQDENTDAGLWWPKGSNHCYIYGAGPWFGTIVDGDTLVTIGYGPHGAETEYVAGIQGMSSSSPDAIIYMYPSPWPPPVGSFPMAPQANRSHQDSWCAYNDLDETAHVPGDTRPIGLEVYQTVYAWNLSTTQDIIFIRWELKNISEAKLTDCYFGVCTDNDIGNEAGTGNDIISGIVGQEYVIDGETLWVDNLGYQWQKERETGWTEFPGTIGFDYLQSPWDLVPGEDKDNDGIPDEYERDSAYYANNVPDSLWDYDLDGTPDWRDPSQIPQLGMTAFKRFTLNLEPNKDNERYVTLAGYNFKTMVYEPFKDTLPPDPDDQRFVQVSGPFELEADSIAVVLVGIILAYWDTLDARSDTALVQIDNTCQFIYDMNWLLPGPPPPPRLTCVPGDAQVTLIWDSGPEHTPDPYYDVVGTDPSSPLYDPYYRQYDFEGYRIWRSMTGQPGDWIKLSYCDQFNSIVFEDTTSIPDDTLLATDTGLSHSYLDTDVRNGFTYHYAVTSYDYNMVKETDTTAKVLKFESGKVAVTSAPRRDPVNLVPGSTYVELIFGNALLADSNVLIDITHPLEMEEDIIHLEFSPVDWGIVVTYDSLNNPDTAVAPVYTANLEDNNQAVIDSVSLVFPLGSFDISHVFKTVNGIAVTARFIKDSLPTDVSLFDSIEVISGDYPIDKLIPTHPNIFANYISLWSYRGNDYEVHWISTVGSSDTANSVIVIDAITGDTIPFAPYLPSDTMPYTNDTLANGWAFMALRGCSDTLVKSGGGTIQTKWLYICGGFFYLFAGGIYGPGDPLPMIGDEWYVYANADFHPAPANCLLRVYSIPAYFDTDTQVEALNVKVCPNPYIIHNEWQQSFSDRRLKFINLPADCTIRVFNLNGELVKTMIHHHTYRVGEGEEEVMNNAGGDEWWNLLSDYGQLVASGVYIFHIQSDIGEQIGKFVIIR